MLNVLNVFHFDFYVVITHQRGRLGLKNMYMICCVKCYDVIF